MGRTWYAIVRQIDVLVALMYMEAITRFARRSLGVIEEIGSIAVHVVVLSFMRVVFTGDFSGKLHYGMAILPFTATGVFIYWLFKTGMANVSAAVFMLHRYSPFPQVTPLDVALARGIVNILIYTLIALGSFWVIIEVGYSLPIRNIVYVIEMLLYAGVFGMGCGLAIAGIFFYFPFVRVVIIVGAFRLLSLISGTFFVIPDLPHKIRDYALYMPLLHMNDMMREAYFATYRAGQADRGYVFACVIGVVCVGLVVERSLRHVSVRRLS
jgi:capsular polysaccharide transport system permease protein